MSLTMTTMFIYFLFVFFLLIITETNASSCKGCVSLDSLSFDKVTSKFKASIVKFDVAYPYGDKHEEYVKVSEAVRDIDDLLVVEVPIKDYGEKDNADLGEQYNVKKDDFPVVKLFLRNKEPVTFTGEFKADVIKKFIRDNSGVYIGLPGCSEEFDKLALQFLQETNKDKRKLILRQTEDLWDKAQGKTNQKNAEVYVKTMRKILEVGNEFTEKEIKRVENILKGKLSKDKKDELETRVNILQSFKIIAKDEL